MGASAKRCLFIFLMGARLGVVASDAPRFTAVDLGPYEANFISADGLILGSDFSGRWLRSGGQRTPLNMSYAMAANRNGYVIGALFAGMYQDAFGESLPYYHACFWSNGVVTDLGTLGGLSSAAYGLNNSNIIVGVANDASNTPLPFVWSNGTMSLRQITVPTNGGWESITPLRIRDDGTIFATARRQNVGHALQLSPGTPGTNDSHDLIDLGVPAGDNPIIYAFDDIGRGCGFARYYNPERVEAFRFNHGTTTLLGNLGSSGSYGKGLNNRDEVVGMSNSQSYRAFLWRDGTIYDLTSCVPTNSGWLLVEANGINDTGQIVGHGILNGTGNINGGGITNGGHRAFLLNPVPGIRLTLEATGVANQWRLRLTHQPINNFGFEVSADLINWSPVNHSSANGAFLIEDSASGPRFFRAVFNP